MCSLNVYAVNKERRKHILVERCNKGYLHINDTFNVLTKVKLESNTIFPNTYFCF